MALGYDGKLYILAFDHRGSFQKKMFGIEGDPTPEETERITDAKHLIYEGMVKATRERARCRATRSACSSTSSSAGRCPSEAKDKGLKLAMPVEKSGQNEFDFEYGDDFGAHIEKFDPDFSKVLVRYNPDDDAELNERQLERLKRLADWLHENDRKFLFELLVPATDEQLASVGGDTDRYDAELRPELMRRAIVETQDFGCEVDIWKIEGVDAREDAEMLAKQTREGAGREGVVCVLLGRGASDEKVDQWLRAASPVEGFVGFAIGRSIWWDALKGFLDGSLDREARRDADRRELPALHPRLRGAGDGGRLSRGCSPVLRAASCGAARRLQHHRGEGSGGGRRACGSARVGAWRGAPAHFERVATPCAGPCGRTSVFPPVDGVGPTFDAGLRRCCETRACTARRTRLRTRRAARAAQAASLDDAVRTRSAAATSGLPPRPSNQPRSTAAP